MKKSVVLLYIQRPRNEEEFELLRPQYASFTAILRGQDWQEIEQFVEANGREGMARPKWRKLKRRLTAPDVAAVVIFNLASTFRRETDLLRFILLCWNLKVDFVSTEVSALSTLSADGRFLARFLVLVHDVLMDGLSFPGPGQHKKQKELPS